MCSISTPKKLLLVYGEIIINAMYSKVLYLDQNKSQNNKTSEGMRQYMCNQTLISIRSQPKFEI